MSSDPQAASRADVKIPYREAVWAEKAAEDSRGSHCLLSFSHKCLWQCRRMPKGQPPPFQLLLFGRSGTSVLTSFWHSHPWHSLSLSPAPPCPADGSFCHEQPWLMHGHSQATHPSPSCWWASAVWDGRIKKQIRSVEKRWEELRGQWQPYCCNIVGSGKVKPSQGYCWRLRDMLIHGNPASHSYSTGKRNQLPRV